MKRLIQGVMLSTILFSTALFAEENGEVQMKNGMEKAWHEKSQQWLGLEAFWRTYAKENGGLTWGQGRNYPNYSDVKEYDLFMVELDSGLCLMEFYHERWRRANDVRRWDDKFNEFSACPVVFN